MTPTFVALHPADLFRNPVMKLPNYYDWGKVKAWLAGEWPLPVPPRTVATDAEEITDWFERAVHEPYVVVDTEYQVRARPQPGRLTLLGMAGPTLPAGLQVWVQTMSEPMRAALMAGLHELVRTVPIVFQNAMADVPVLEAAFGLHYGHYRRIDDTMLAHSALWSEWPHDLEFLASVYGRHPKMKHLRHSDPLLYNWGDVVDTMSIWEGVDAELDADPPSRQVYEGQLLPLIPIVIERQRVGIRTNAKRVESADREYREKLAEAEGLGQAYAGWPLKLSSPEQIKLMLYTVEGFPVQKNKDTKKATVDGDAMAVLRSLADEEHPLIEARIAYSEAAQAHSHYIAPLMED